MYRIQIVYIIHRKKYKFLLFFQLDGKETMMNRSTAESGGDTLLVEVDYQVKIFLNFKIE